MTRFLAVFIALLFCVPSWAIDRNVSGQKLVVQVLDRTTGGPKTGDAANLTCYVSIDGDTTPDALGDTSATELSSTDAPGLYQFDLTQGETNGINIVYSGKSATASTDVVPRFVVTIPGGFSAGTASVDATAISGDTVAADRLETMLDGTGGNTLSLGALAVTGGATIANSGGTALTLSSSGGNGHGLNISGNGTGTGATIAAGATAMGLSITGGATSGRALSVTATSGTAFHITTDSGTAILAQSGGGNGHGLSVTGEGTGEGFKATAGATGNGMEITGGGTGHGALFTGGNGLTGNAITATAASTNGHGFATTGIGSGEGLIATGGASGNGAEFDGGASGDDVALTGDDWPDIVDLIWDEATSGHSTAGTTGKAVADAALAGNPWASLLVDEDDPGSFGEAINEVYIAISTADGIDDLVTAITEDMQVAAFNVDPENTWRFDSRNQVTASNNVTEATGSAAVLVSMDFTIPMPALSSISTVNSVTIADVSNETEPTITSSAKSADSKKVNIILDASLGTDATYTVTVSITTTDSQTITRRGRLVLQ